MGAARSLAAGVAGTTVMTALALAAPRPFRTPQMLGSALTDDRAAQPVIGYALHFGAGAALALPYGALRSRRRGVAGAVLGLAHGVAATAFSHAALRRHPDPERWRGDLPRLPESLAAHAVYGATVALLSAT